MKKNLKFPSWGMVILFVIMLFCSGCETLKGMQRDFQKIADWDKEFQEKYW